MGTPSLERPQSGADGPLAQMVELARRYGRDSEFVRAGGGNSSAKVDGVLHIKPSGVSLAGLTEDSLVALDLEPLLRLLHADGPDDAQPGSDPILRAAALARRPPLDDRRPSVELLFHALLPEAIVLHTHPTTINALTCSTDGRAIAERVLGDDVLWVPYTDPGLPLARAIHDAREARRAGTGGSVPSAVLLQNHGLIVAGESAAEIDQRTRAIAGRIAAHLDGRPQLDWGQVERTDRALASGIVDALRPAIGMALAPAGQAAEVAFDGSPLATEVAGSAIGRRLAGGGPLTPDQIVYAGSWPLVVEPAPTDAAAAIAAVKSALAERAKRGVEPPIIVLVAGLGLFAVGATEGGADTARLLFVDAMTVASGAERLGGVRPLAPDERQFIERWEAEAYRRGVAAQAGFSGSQGAPA